MVEIFFTVPNLSFHPYQSNLAWRNPQPENIHSCQETVGERITARFQQVRQQAFGDNNNIAKVKGWGDPNGVGRGGDKLGLALIGVKNIVGFLVSKGSDFATRF